MQRLSRKPVTSTILSPIFLHQLLPHNGYLIPIQGRNWVEVFYREAKGWLGLKKYQVREK